MHQDPRVWSENAGMGGGGGGVSGKQRWGGDRRGHSWRAFFGEVVHVWNVSGVCWAPRRHDGRSHVRAGLPVVQPAAVGNKELGEFVERRAEGTAVLDAVMGQQELQVPQERGGGGGSGRGFCRVGAACTVGCGGDSGEEHWGARSVKALDRTPATCRDPGRPGRLSSPSSWGSASHRHTESSLQQHDVLAG